MDDIATLEELRDWLRRYFNDPTTYERADALDRMLTERAKMEWRKDCFGQDGRALYLGSICVGHVSGPVSTGWRAWLQTDEEGDRIGKDTWPTMEVAKQAVYEAANRALTAPQPPEATTDE